MTAFALRAAGRCVGGPRHHHAPRHAAGGPGRFAPGAWLLMGGPRHRRGFGPGGHFGPAGFGPGGPFGGPGGPFGGPPFFGGRKRGRGDIRAALLALLAEGPMHGYQMMRELAERSQGAWRPSPGSVYPTLQQLEDEGLVLAQEEGGKRVFALTDAGREAAAQATSPKPWEAAAAETDDAVAGLRDLALQVMAATRQVVHAGTPAQLEQAKAVLKAARRDLYRILAEDDEGETQGT